MNAFAALNASYSFYMYEGGTNFGYNSSLYVTTSYDYSAPLTEAGNYSFSYQLIRNNIMVAISSSAFLPPDSLCRQCLASDGQETAATTASQPSASVRAGSDEDGGRCE